MLFQKQIFPTKTSIQKPDVSGRIFFHTPKTHRPMIFVPKPGGYKVFDPGLATMTWLKSPLDFSFMFASFLGDNTPQQGIENVRKMNNTTILSQIIFLNYIWLDKYNLFFAKKRNYMVLIIIIWYMHISHMYMIFHTSTLSKQISHSKSLHHQRWSKNPLNPLVSISLVARVRLPETQRKFSP